MKASALLMIALMIIACSEAPIVDEYRFEDGRVWIDVTTESGVGSQINEARKLFHQRAVKICGSLNYQESEIRENNQASGYMQSGIINDYVTQISHRTGFVVCENSDKPA